MLWCVSLVCTVRKLYAISVSDGALLISAVGDVFNRKGYRCSIIRPRFVQCMTVLVWHAPFQCCTRFLWLSIIVDYSKTLISTARGLLRRGVTSSVIERTCFFICVSLTFTVYLLPFRCYKRFSHCSRWRARKKLTSLFDFLILLCTAG
jgi:hypothetical protein